LSERLLQTDSALSRSVVKAQASVPYAVLPMYLMVGVPAYEQDPQRIAAIWTAIAAVRKSAEYRKQESQALRSMKID